MGHKSLKIFQKRICATTTHTARGIEKTVSFCLKTVWSVSHPVKMKTNKSFGSWKQKGEICCMLTTQQTDTQKDLAYIGKKKEDVVFCQCVCDGWI